MTPVLLQLGPIIIYTMWLFISMGIVFGMLLLHRLSQKSRTKIKVMFNHLFFIFGLALIFSRLLFIAINWQMYFFEFKLSELKYTFYIWDRDLSAWGAIIGLLISTIIIAIKYKENIISWFDRLIIAIIGTTIFTNIGAFFEGLNYGNESSLPWAITFESGMIKYSVPIHPTQIYAAIYSLILTIILYQLSKRKFGSTTGNITLLGTGLYSFGIFIEGFFRGDDILSFAHIRLDQWISLIICLSTIAISIYIKKRPSENKNNDFTAKTAL